MKILIASTNAPGHLNPMLAAARILLKHKHEVLLQTGSELRAKVEAAGVPFLPFSPAADRPIWDIVADTLAERQERTLGFDLFRFNVENVFASQISAQAEGLTSALRDFPADLILASSFFLGTLPLLLGPREDRPAIAHLGISVLNLGSGKDLPRAAGSSEKDDQDRMRLLLNPIQDAMNKRLAEAGCRPLPCPALEAMSQLPDIYLHPGIQGFEYPSSPPETSRVRYIGSLPLPPGHAPLPDWWHELDKTKRIVLVTQGTVANRDFGLLVAPALTALAEEKDLIILVTTGGQPAESIPVEIPANARVTEFLPYENILSRVDLLITNGGYGTVNLALAYGVPIITAGKTEDKEEVSAHVEWSGAGIDLKTNQADPVVLRIAAREILYSPKYSQRAKELAEEFKRHNTALELVDLLENCAAEKTRTEKARRISLMLANGTASSSNLGLFHRASPDRHSPFVEAT